MMSMTLLQPRHDELRGPAGEGRSMLARALGLLCWACRLMHRAIVEAKVRRLQNEFALENKGPDEPSRMHNATRYPQRPLILGDKWDF
jgi:hypothetical protein